MPAFSINFKECDMNRHSKNDSLSSTTLGKANIYIFVYIALLFIFMSCTPLKPFEKEYLLGPLMEDSALTSLNSSFVSSIFPYFEKLSSGGTGSSSTSCPTCGG